jgi:hypothetical protein
MVLPVPVARERRMRMAWPRFSWMRIFSKAARMAASW